MANKTATYMTTLHAQTADAAYIDWAKEQHPSLDLGELTPEELVVLETAIPKALDFLQGEFTQRVRALQVRFTDRDDLEAQKLLNKSDLEDFIANLYDRLEDIIAIPDSEDVEAGMILDIVIAIVEPEISQQLVELRATATELRKGNAHQEPRQRLRAL